MSQNITDGECEGCVRASHGVHCAWKPMGICVNGSKYEEKNEGKQ